MFCRKCGKEVLDEAAFCTGCGCWLDNAPKKQEKNREDKAEKFAKLSKLFGILAFSFIMTTLFFVFIAIAGAELTNDLYWYSDEYMIYWDEVGVAWAIVTACPALGFGITSFVLSKKAKENIAVRYISTLIFIMSIVVFLIPFVFIE